eukprot:2045126-Amphidinium_carterae.1
MTKKCMSVCGQFASPVTVILEDPPHLPQTSQNTKPNPPTIYVICLFYSPFPSRFSPSSGWHGRGVIRGGVFWLISWREERNISA